MEENGFATEEELMQLTEEEYVFFIGRFNEVHAEIEATLGDQILVDEEKVARVTAILENAHGFSNDYFALRGIR